MTSTAPTKYGIGPAAARESRERTPIGIAALLLSTALFPLSDTLAKALVGDYPGLEVAWMRYVVLLSALLPILVRRPGVLRTARPLLQLSRGATLAAATTLTLAGFTYLPVADATAIAFCTPLIVTGLAAVFLKEHVGAVRWSAAAVGFAGVVVIVQPGGNGFHPAAVLPLLSSAFSAFTVILTRLGRNERIETTIIASAAVGLLTLSVPIAFVWKAPDWSGILLGLAMGSLAAAATMLQLFAYRCASASALAPFSYVQIVFALGIGWLLTGAVPSLSMVAGSIIVIGSGAAAGLPARSTSRRRQIDWSRVRRDLWRLQPSSRSA